MDMVESPSQCCKTSILTDSTLNQRTGRFIGKIRALSNSAAPFCRDTLASVIGRATAAWYMCRFRVAVHGMFQPNLVQPDDVCPALRLACGTVCK
jgi:hypothetical protein